MCSHESITWTITDNSVTDRMLENSLIHKFRRSRKIRKSTKLLNTEIKKHCSVTDYLHYVELKTNVTRNLVKDTDTSDSSSLSDVDYDIIYNSSKRAKYKARDFQNYVSVSEEDYKGCNRRTVIRKKKNKGTERRVQVRKSPRLNPVVSEECINTGWQEVINKNNSVPRKRSYTNISNNKRNMKINDCIHSRAQSNKQSLSPQLDSQIGLTSNIMKSGNKYVRQNHEDFDAIDNKLSSKDNTISNKIKPVSKRKLQNKKDQSATINESNIELDSHGLHYHSSLPQSTSLENSTNADNELNSLVKSKDNINKSTAIIESSINAKNCNAYINYKPKLLKDVKRNLIPALEKADCMNHSKDITDKNIGNELSYDQLLPDIVNFDRYHSTPLKKIQTNIPNKDSSSDVLQDQQKDSGIDEDSQDKLVKIEKSNKIPMNQNMEKNAKKIFISSLELKKIDEVFETMEDSVEVVKDPHFNDILREQINKEERTPSGEEEMKNAPQLNQINMNVETNEKDENSVKANDSSDIQKQQLLSPKQDCMKKTHSKPCSLIQEEEDDRIVKIPAEEEKDISLQLKEDNVKVDVEVPSINHKGKQNSKEEKEFSEEKIKNFPQLNQIGNVTEIRSINHEDRTHFVKSENSLDVQKQQVLSPKENHIKDIYPKSNNNILDENNRQTNDEKEVNNFFQLNEVDKNGERHLINQEDEACMDTHDTQKHQTSLPKITCTEILNKKYKLIYKEDDVVKSNIETLDKIDNTNISNENPSIRKNTLIYCPDVVDHNTDNLQETTINEEEIEIPMTLETDNEEDNMNYMSPQTKKRLQQQARLNLIVNSDSSESDDEYVTKISQKHIDSSNMNYCNEDDNLSNDEINCAPKQTETVISCREVKLDIMNMKENIEKTESLISCTYENNDSLQSATNKNRLQETPNCENVHNDNQSRENLIESLQLRVSDSDVSCNSKKSINEFQKHKQSMLDKENICTKSNQNEEAISTEFKTRHESEHKQSTQASIKCSNTHLNSSCQYRPCNLQQLIEDQDLFVETIPASFTLTDLSEDEEAFILNVPSKVLQSNLQGQVLTLKDKSIKLNENKYRIVCKEVGTTSCIFATGKKQKPYKIINIKNISTITVREKLPQDSRKSDVLNSNNTVSSMPKVLNKNQQTDTKRNSKWLKIFNKKRKRKESSDPET
ncbi:PREDICTED: LOW QUALITY PROTEIN: putative leucine-rich repeat-containing protein DDB_G0290503 [Acromyrmex echinatior]|uniref:LOW QUALITY PROTEIN: putative leucine-rich repeat-containing protein DDB_G0290503 n=1 Tax=Acromyrmex echinatior TaxID=103372 RepID=UPI000580EF88|nr:PREDICTED: LOW QUALITY PROTEIN: putative leucine-rich repeat-containing protein DDB_G0290503 [Acromyrmex echinatior]